MPAARLLASFPQEELTTTNRLLADYQHRQAGILECFDQHPDQLIAFASRTHAYTDRSRLADALTAFQQNLGAAEDSVNAARLLADPATLVVTVGQQSGLLTGPLYTIYKAITALNIARQLARELGRPVVPVFWAATDDDDRSEADHCAFLDQHFTPHTLRYSETFGSPGSLIGDLPTDDAGEHVLAEVMPLIAGLPYADEVGALLHDTLHASADMGEWFCRLLVRLFSSWGMVVCDPRLSELRQLSAEILRRELSSPLVTTAAVNARARDLRRMGYRPQLTKPDDVCNVFYLDHRRQRIAYRNGKYVLGDAELSADEVLARVADHPTQFMPNAVLRPVVQEYLFSSAAFVTGPNELGYWAELQPVFAALHVTMPVVVPRAAAAIVPHNVNRFLQKWEIPYPDMVQDFDTVRSVVLEKIEPAAVRQQFQYSRETVEHIVSALTGVVTQVDKTLAQSALASHQRMLNELERLERKTQKAVERQSADVMARLDLAHEVLCPHGGLQERDINVFSMCAHFGFDVLQNLRTLLDKEEGKHVVVEL
ncbi:MAG TPA: bacillithiol biosynthesis cysteine-adding enzyme BshC [Armatimonadota bacterium]|nr:bacillithiol biosynthesis cysteine-adding enzyme BshC [Armatimonadota bacterium]